tara:strand:- start:517 stop:639 length:123 start_codon:yes stop_codon:yes gene_type:complete
VVNIFIVIIVIAFIIITDDGTMFPAFLSSLSSLAPHHQIY